MDRQTACWRRYYYRSSTLLLAANINTQTQHQTAVSFWRHRYNNHTQHVCKPQWDAPRHSGGGRVVFETTRGGGSARRMLQCLRDQEKRYFTTSLRQTWHYGFNPPSSTFWPFDHRDGFQLWAAHAVRWRPQQISQVLKDWLHKTISQHNGAVHI